MIPLYKKYIEEEDSLIEIKKKIDEEKIKSETELDKINSNAFLLINLSKQKQKLIDTNLSGNYEREINLIGNWGSGFTYNDDLLNLDNGSLSNEDYNIIYDELERMYDEIIDQIKKDEDYDDNKKKEDKSLNQQSKKSLKSKKEEKEKSDSESQKSSSSSGSGSSSNKTKEMNENNSGDDKNDKDKDKEKNSEGDSTYRAE